MDQGSPGRMDNEGNPHVVMIPPDNALSTEFEPGLVSVIIPTFNREQLLGQTLESVVCQDYRPIEIVVVDDGSSDNTEDVVSKWRDEWDDSLGLEIRYLVQSNSGAPAARNRGMLESRGEFLQFLDSDDCLHRSKVGLHVACLKRQPNADFAYGPIKELENPEHAIYCQTEMTPRRMAFKQVVNPAFQTSGPLCRRSMFAKVGIWNEGIAPMEDWELFSRATVMGCLGAYVPDAVTYHRMDVADRLRWSGDKEGLDQYLHGRFVQLESMLTHASQQFLEDRDFRSLIAWQLMRVASEGILRGWSGDYLKRLDQARWIARDSFPARIATSVLLVQRLCGEHVAAVYCLTFPWLYFRWQGLRSRVKRAIGSHC